MLRVDGKEYYSTKEAAVRLGLTQSAVQDAIWRGVLAATQFADIPHRSFIESGELDRYASERRGNQGWEVRKTPGYEPNRKRREYQRAYRERKRLVAEPERPTYRTKNEGTSR
ncbi:MAG TPA: hypothetical protein VFE42_31175 [Chloroflexota bacterium]|nr:hypothetical protein [Chloroflexota bacterium]